MNFLSFRDRLACGAEKPIARVQTALSVSDPAATGFVATHRCSAYASVEREIPRSTHRPQRSQSMR
jgi:hypothetical protein